MEIIELLLDEENDNAGIDAISIVSSPAIESNFLSLKSQEIKFAKVDDEKRILMGAALIPNKPIYRKDEKKEYYVYFSADTFLSAGVNLSISDFSETSAYLIDGGRTQYITIPYFYLFGPSTTATEIGFGLSVSNGSSSTVNFRVLSGMLGNLR